MERKKRKGIRSTIRNGLEEKKENKKEKRMGRKKRKKNGLLVKRDGGGRGYHEGDGSWAIWKRRRIDKEAKWIRMKGRR